MAIVPLGNATLGNPKNKIIDFTCSERQKYLFGSIALNRRVNAFEPNTKSPYLAIVPLGNPVWETPGKNSQLIVDFTALLILTDIDAIFTQSHQSGKKIMGGFESDRYPHFFTIATRFFSSKKWNRLFPLVGIEILLATNSFNTGSNLKSFPIYSTPSFPPYMAIREIYASFALIFFCVYMAYFKACS